MEKKTVAPPTNPGAKRAALITLVVQNSLLILTMRYSRVVGGKVLYLTSTAVLLNELIKLAFCFAVSAREIGVRQTAIEVFGEDSWKMAVPAALYTMQNSMQYVAASNLEAATFQVTYQLKILTTAFFAVVILHKRLRGLQWGALFLLAGGVALVQLPDDIWTKGVSFKAAPKSREELNSSFTGIVAVTIACLLSGLAGIYFEKVLKDSRKVSLWVRNVQLSFFSVWPALIFGVLLKDMDKIRQYGFFVGYNPVVVTVILLQAFGGIIVALVVKYADNIAKNFATSMSIIISAVASVYVFGTSIHMNFVLGAFTVIGATFLYSSAEKKN